jgi:hypothetical protein
MGENPRETKQSCSCGEPKICAEAQADGVPCWELGRKCETCERAYMQRHGEPPPLRKPPPAHSPGFRAS